MEQQQKTLTAQLLSLSLFALTTPSWADSSQITDDVNQCILSYINKIQAEDSSLDVSKTISAVDLAKHCQNKQLVKIEKPKIKGALRQRLAQEKATEYNPFVLTPHMMNYILPATYVTQVNTKPYERFDVPKENFNKAEVKFQLSVKVPLFSRDFFVKDDAFYFGITLKSFWQLYAGEISAPFRETNYKPEVFYIMPLNHEPFGGNTDLVLGFEHESNGQPQPLSRSWNRLYLNFLYEQNDFAVSFKPFYRIPEKDKTDILQANGDDNPDIYHYMGYFEFGAAYKYEDYRFSLLGRRNFVHGNGALELGWTFPISGRIRGYVQYFNGYGESLIDYNHYQQRIGIGIALTDFL